MRKHSFLTMPLLALSSLALAQPALASRYDTYVNGHGNTTDTGDCNYSAPCASITYALTQTLAGGIIQVNAMGYYGTAVASQSGPYEVIIIDKSVTIAGNGNTAGAGNPNGSVFIINAGASDRVEIVNMRIANVGDASATPNAASPVGVKVIRAKDVLLHNCEITGFAVGVQLANTSATRLTLDHMKLVGNTYGVQISSAPGLGHLKMFDSFLLTNPSAGVQVIGPGNDVLLSGTTVLGSTKALDLVAGAGAISYGGNILTSGDAPVTTMSKL